MKYLRLHRIANAMLISVLFVVVFLAGCYKQQANFESGYFGYTNHPPQIMIGVRSETDTFSRDNIIFDLYYGFHDIGYDEKYNHDPKGSYLAANRKNVILCLYFGHYLIDDFEFNGEFKDYKSLENHYFVKEISEEDAFSDEYGYTMTYRNGITYNHYETVAVPQECLIENEYGIGFIRIELMAFCEPLNEDDYYYTSANGVLGLRYENIDDNTIKISFTNKK